MGVGVALTPGGNDALVLYGIPTLATCAAGVSGADEANKHPLYDSFWKERAAFEQLDKIRIPVFSIGIWAKVELRLRGNIVGYQHVNSPKKLLVTASCLVGCSREERASSANPTKIWLEGRVR
jgi:predicted acyl esterase